MRQLAIIGLVIGLAPVLIFTTLSLGVRTEMVPFRLIFTQMKWLVPALALGGAVLLGTALVALFAVRQVSLAVLALIGMLAAFAMAAGPLQMKKQGGAVPPIHDISTDLVDPPAFEVTAPMRTDEMNPAAYDPAQGPEQQKAYPDIVPIRVRQSVDVVFTRAEAALQAAGLQIVAADRATGRLEATATSRWFGFKDDVVVRLRALETGGTQIDIRSKSRVGRSDLGANAARIRQLRTHLLTELDEV